MAAYNRGKDDSLGSGQQGLLPEGQDRGPMKIVGVAERERPRRLSVYNWLAAGALLAAGMAQAQTASSAVQRSSQAGAAPVAGTATVPPQSPAARKADAYYHFALGHLDEQTAQQYGRPDLANRAIQQYTKALAADPDSLFLQNSLAMTYFRLGRIREAIEAAQQILKKDPNNVQAHKLLGQIYLRSLGDPDSGQQSGPMLDLAVEQFQKLVTLEPNTVENHLVLGQLYTMKHDNADARAQFEAARRINPSSEAVLLNLAHMQDVQGNPAEALKTLESVPESDRTPRIDLAIAGLYDRQKKTKQATAAYQAALAAQPDNIDAQRGLAEDLLMQNDTESALKLYEGITTQDPEDAHSFLRLAELERSLGHLRQAQAALEHARALDPDSIELHYNEAMLDESEGHLNEAADTLSQLVKVTTRPDGQYSSDEKNNRAIFLSRLAGVYREQNKTQEAVNTYQQMIALGGDYAARGYQGIVDTYRDAKMYPQATEAAEQAAKAQPGNSDLQLTLATELADTGKAKEGVALAKAQLKNNANDRVVWLTLAQMYTRLRKWKDASNAIQQADKLSTTNQEKALVAFLRGALEERQKHIPQAEQSFRESLQLDPDNALTLNYLGYMLADRGEKLPEALAMIEHAVKLDPENGAYLDSLGWVRYKMGQYSKALETLQKASALMPADPTVHDHLGEVYAATGNLQGAVTQWQSSLKDYAASVPADAEPSDVSKVRKRLDKAKAKLAKEQAHATAPSKP
jgi:tetratricopeptide (TPR) repeat protein